MVFRCGGYESGGPAPTPTGTPASGTGLTGQYFNSNNFTNLAYTQTDPAVHFNWGSDGPTGSCPPSLLHRRSSGATFRRVGVPADNFSIRWSGQVQPRFSETYTFCVYHQKNDLVKLYVNGQVLVNVWTYGEWGEACGTIALTAGTKYTLTLEFVDIVDNAAVTLYWSSPTQYKEVIPASQLFPSAPTPTPTPTATTTLTSTATSTYTPTSTISAPSGQVWKTYYYAGSQRVAVRITGSANPQENGLFYTLGDHLGSLPRPITKRR